MPFNSFTEVSDKFKQCGMKELTAPHVPGVKLAAEGSILRASQDLHANAIRLATLIARTPAGESTLKAQEIVRQIEQLTQTISRESR